MSSPESEQSLPSIAALKLECHRLIEAIARRPGAIKLLLGAKAALATYAAYKANRQSIKQRRNRD